MFDPLAIATRAKLLGDLYYFSRYAFNQSTGQKWMRNWHHRTICSKLEQVFSGDIKRLIINIPPRYSKTELAVVNFIPWCLAQHPDCEFIHASYSARLAANNSWKARNIVSTEWYRRYFPDVNLAADFNARDDWRTTAGGIVYSTGAGGTITGFGAGKVREGFGGAIIIDDPHKADEAQSDVIRHSVIDWYQNTVMSRVNSPDTPIIVIMQRLHEEDLSGWLLKGGTGEEWDHLCIPALDEQGTALWPAKHTVEQLRQIERTSSYVFAGQYMQLPSPLGGGIFKDSWWRYYRREAMPKPRRIVHSWDTAFKSKEENDPSSGTIWAECEDGYYLLDRINERMEFPELKRKLQMAYDKWGGNTILVEDKASGQSLIQDLKQTRLPIVPVKVDKDKVSRAFAVTGLVEGGRVFLPEGEPWVLDYVRQLGTFPNAAHDDDVDSTSQALNYFIKQKGSKGILEYYRQAAEQEAEAKAKTKEREAA